jgi:hypothetical protein
MSDLCLNHLAQRGITKENRFFRSWKPTLNPFERGVNRFVTSSAMPVGETTRYERDDNAHANTRNRRRVCESVNEGWMTPQRSSWMRC